MLCSGVEQLLRAIGRAYATADATREPAADVSYDGGVVTAPHRGVEIDDLHFRKALESSDPVKHVAVFDGEPLALHELHDGAGLEVDGWDQHVAYRRTGIPRCFKCSFSPRTLVSA